MHLTCYLSVSNYMSANKCYDLLLFKKQLMEGNHQTVYLCYGLSVMMGLYCLEILIVFTKFTGLSCIQHSYNHRDERGKTIGCQTKIKSEYI